MKINFSKITPILVISGVVIIFFWKFFLQGLIPLSGDTVLGMYMPWKDMVWERGVSGYPVRNFLLTDPVRQNYPWKVLSTEIFKSGQWPLWNPFNFSGGPFLANFQSAVFYPVNLLFFLLPSPLAWSFFIIVQPILAAIFTYLFLHNLKLSGLASVFGGLIFAFSGFMVSWSEWGTLGHTALWLPLALFLVDKILNEYNFKWFFILSLTLAVQLLAGHFQISFYVYLMMIIYIFARLWQKKRIVKSIFLLIIAIILSLLIGAIQLLPTLELASLSSRLDYYGQGARYDFYLPFKHLAMFLTPNFFGTPAKLNYWGDFNYIEFNGYIGSLTLFFALLAIFFRRDKKTFFFAAASIFFLSFTLPTPWAKLPYLFNLPLYKTLAPTRLMFLIDFSLATLAALGLDLLLKNQINFKKITRLFIIFLSIYLFLWLFIAINVVYLSYPWSHQLEITARNLLIPFIILIIGGSFLLSFVRFRQFKFRHLIPYGLVLLTSLDLFWIHQEYTPFIKKELIFPKTKTIEFLQSQPKPFRILITDQLIMPANFSIIYNLESLDGYDSLYSKRYNELISAGQRNYFDDKGDVFGRIIYLDKTDSKIFNMLGAKFVLSKKIINSPKLKLVFQEGDLLTYENPESAPRAFLVPDWQIEKNDSRILSLLVNKDFDVRKTALLEENPVFPDNINQTSDQTESISINKLTANNINLSVNTKKPQILIISQSHFPGWKANINSQPASVLRANYDIIAIPVGTGKQTVDLFYDPTSFKTGLLISYIGLGILLLSTLLVKKIHG